MMAGGAPLIPNGHTTPIHQTMHRMDSRNLQLRRTRFSRSLAAIFSTVRSPFASRVGQGNHQQRDCELDSLLRFSLRQTAVFISTNTATGIAIRTVKMGGESGDNSTAQIEGYAQGENSGRQAYQGVVERGNNAVGDGERITRHIDASSIPYHDAHAEIGSVCSTSGYRLMPL